MPSDGGKLMHPDFPRWYREVDVQQNRDRLQRRWGGIIAYVQSMTPPDVENTLGVVFRSQLSPSAEGLARIRKPFKDTDDLFDMAGNDREVEILCGSILAVLIEGNGSLAAPAALSITTSALNGSRSANLPINLQDLAETTIDRISDIARKRPETASVLQEPIPIKFSGLAEKLQQQFDSASVAAAFDQMAITVAAGLDGLKKIAEASMAKTNNYLAIQDEELEMLWWLFGERSEDLQQPFKDVPAKAQPLVFAKELADATQFLPGPRSIKGLLIRAGLTDSKKLTIPEVVNSCPADWLMSLNIENIFPLSHPIHHAISRRNETNDGNSWIAGWAISSGLDATATYPSLTLGTLFYRERLLVLFN